MPFRQVSSTQPKSSHLYLLYRWKRDVHTVGRERTSQKVSVEKDNSYLILVTIFHSQVHIFLIFKKFRFH